MSESTYPSVNDLTLEEKASLTSGGDAWHLQGVEAKGIPRLHDHRRPPRPAQVQSGHHRRSRPEQLRACHLCLSTWNPNPIHQVGEAGEECIQEKVGLSSSEASPSNTIGLKICIWRHEVGHSPRNLKHFQEN